MVQVEGTAVSGRGAVVGLDIGHATICACIGRVDDGRVHLFGSSVVATDGVERGAIVDERRLASAVARALDQVEQMSNMRSEKRVVLGVGGAFVGGWPGAAGTDLQFGPLAKLVRGLGLHVEHVVPTAQAAARAVLLPAERTRTAAVVDIGEESSDVVFFRDGGAVLHAVVPVGGRHVTHDIAYGLGVSVAEAEQLKLRFAAAIQELTTVPRVGGAATERALGLFDIVEPRIAELFELVSEVLSDAFDGGRPDSVILTGGSSLLAGIQQAAERTLDTFVRIGVAQATVGPANVVTSPVYAGAIGLLHEAPMDSDVPFTQANGAPRRRWLDSVKHWLSEFL